MTDKATGWIPLLGEFDITPMKIVFRGKTILAPPVGSPPGAEATERASIGLLASSLALGDGDISAEVIFDEVTEDSICELAAIYDPNASHLVCAGLGGDRGAMFSLREYGGP